MVASQPTTLECTALYILRELNSLSPEQAYLCMLDLLSLMDKQWIDALCIAYTRQQNWDSYVQLASTAKTPIPPSIKKGILSPHMIKWTRHT